VLAELPEEYDPKAVCRSVRAEAMRFWREDLAAPVRQACAALIAGDSDLMWQEQIDTFVEFTATWSPLDDYGTARRSVEQAVAARKNLREFYQWEHLRGNVPLSSLDGARETLLRPGKLRDVRLARRYRIAEGEQLDAIGLVKRAGGDPGQFLPIFNVALAAWVDLAQREAPEELDTIKIACSEIRLARVERKDLPAGRQFSYDAGIFYRGRWKSILKQLEVSDPVRWGTQWIQPLLSRLSEPSPYVACVVADGDNMGCVIERLESVAAHRALSRALSQFTLRTREIVEQGHWGSLVYAGGDDVVAFLPVAHVLSCAQKLRETFQSTIESACSWIAPEERPTLSVGIGIGHVMESMGELLNLGRQAERLAKGSSDETARRNALGVIVSKRSGGVHRWRARWDQPDGDPVQQIEETMACLERVLSTRKIYEMDRTLRRLPKPLPEHQGRSDLDRLLMLEMRRSLSRTHAGQSAVDPAEIGLPTEPSQYKQSYAIAVNVLSRLMVAKELAAARPSVRRTS
jgi:CRISPR-associated protein Cmr2